MKLQHGRLRLDVPPGWSDQSTILLVAPAPGTGSDAPPTASRLTSATQAIAVTFAAAGDDDARALLAQERARLEKLDAALEVLDDAPFSCALGDGWSTVHRYRIGDARLRQISTCVVVGPVAVLAAASAGDAVFDQQAPALWGVLRSFELAPPAPSAPEAT